MKESGTFIEIGIKDWSYNNNTGYASTCQIPEECLIRKIDASLRRLFPKNSVEMCDSILCDLFRGWTVGVVESSDRQIMRLSEEYPGVCFVVKSLDNYAVEFRLVKNGILPENPDAEVSFIVNSKVEEIRG